MGKPKNYKHEDFIHYIQVRRDDKENTNTLDLKNNKTPSKDRYEISFEDIERMNLNKVGNEIPYASMNVVNLERYMLYYWSLIMDSDCILLYLHLWEYCDRSNGVDICYPKMTELQAKMGMSKPTLIKKIKMLEENNFLVQIHRLNKLDNNRETSPIFKLRQTIPMLSYEQYKKLPKIMQKKHDAYMEKFVKESQMERLSRKGTETIQFLIEQKGNKMITSKMREKINEVISHEQEFDFIQNNLPEHMKNSLVESTKLYEHLQQNGLSKPASEFIFKDCITAYDSNVMTAYIITPDESARDYIKDNLTDYQKDILSKTLISIYEQVFDYKIYTRKSYILKVLKSE